MAISKNSLANLRPIKKGEVRNPGGRPKIPEDVKEMARGLCPEAIQTLGEVMKDKDAPPAARVSAASTILDRGYGKAPQHITAERVDSLSDAQLADELAAAIAGLRALGVDTARISFSGTNPREGEIIPCSELSY
jgi:hypothetical protein